MNNPQFDEEAHRRAAWDAYYAHQAHAAQQQPQWQPPQVQQSVVVNNRGGGCNHPLHFVLTLFTAGLWLPVWILCAVFARR